MQHFVKATFKTGWPPL